LKGPLVLQRSETSSLVLTVLDMQPRQSGVGSGKSSDAVVYEMADSILEKVVDKLDMDEAKADMFQVLSFFIIAKVRAEMFSARTISLWRYFENIFF